MQINRPSHDCCCGGGNARHLFNHINKKHLLEYEERLQLWSGLRPSSGGFGQPVKPKCQTSIEEAFNCDVTTLPVQ